MSDFAIWGFGVGASAVVVVAAVVAYAWYSHLRSRLPLVVYYKDLESRVSDLKAKFTDLVAEVKRHRQEVGNLLQEKMTLEAEIGDARAWLDKNRILLEQLPVKRTEIAETEEKLRRVRQEWLQAQAQRLEEEEKAATARREVERAQAEMTELTALRSRLQSYVETLQQKQTALQVETGKLELDCKKAADQLERLRSELAREEKRLAAIQEESKRAKAEQREADLARDEASAKKDSLLREIALKERDLGRLQREHETLSKKVEHFEQMVRAPSMAERLEDFTKPAIAVRSNIQPLSATGDGGERTRLEECARYFERNKYKFHARTLSAFHTSLKTADISPLVVLAGISGTGKSQLPRLYAEALGIHFLNVAVQPRWDAPQDLFGFYNYMEHRYKATELARALRQMDVRRALDAGEDTRVRDGVLLVLLDEMNLARVEYYFSELLSKLEMRNVAGTGDGQGRHPAAIEIDAGSLGRDDQPERLFVGHNVLFAGTMNEDETTQALSDKVIDRSNVLRFGKPGQLRKDKPPTVPAPDYYLRYEDWKSWLRPDLPAGEADTFGEICDSLNTVLARIHRPFGHRVHQAMYRYAANYPRWAADWFHCAMADQFEQKIIPRLRGLSHEERENEEVLAEIGTLIHGLGDSALTSAFGAARERPVFQWAGVNREAEHA